LRAAPNEKPDVTIAGVEEVVPNLKMSAAEDEAAAGCDVAEPPNVKLLAGSPGFWAGADDPNWKIDAGFDASVDSDGAEATLGVESPNWKVPAVVVTAAAPITEDGFVSGAFPKLKSDGGSDGAEVDESAGFPNENENPDFVSSAGFAAPPNTNVDGASFFSTFGAPKENDDACFASDADPNANIEGFSSAFLIASPKLKAGAGSLSFLSLPPRVADEAANALPKLGGFDSSGFGNASDDGAAAVEDPKPNSDGFAEAVVVVTAAAVVSPVAADPNVKVAGGLSAVVVETAGDDPRPKTAGFTASDGSVFFSVADEPKEKIAGSDGAAVEAVVVAVEAVDCPKEKENVGFGSVAAVVAAAVVVAAVVVVVVAAAASVAAVFCKTPKENPPKPEEVVLGTE
jgi:hypothetical protein